MHQSSPIASVIQSIQATTDRLLARKSAIVIAIDGRCGAGKSTLAACLADALSATVIHADDFFLRPEQRTEARFAEPGGNMDRERLMEEVLIPLSHGIPFTYRPFDCHTLALKAPVEVFPSPITVVEGSYTCHPELWKYYDLHIFMDIDPQTQLSRIEARSGSDAVRRFAERWIPLEERYFSAYPIAERFEMIVRL